MGKGIGINGMGGRQGHTYQVARLATDRVTRGCPWEQRGGGGGQGHRAEGARRPAGQRWTGSPRRGRGEVVPPPSARSSDTSPDRCSIRWTHQDQGARESITSFWRRSGGVLVSRGAMGLLKSHTKSATFAGLYCAANRCTECDTTSKFGGYMEGWMLSTTCSRGVRGIIKRLGWLGLTVGVAPMSAPLCFTHQPADRQLNRSVRTSTGRAGPRPVWRC